MDINAIQAAIQGATLDRDVVSGTRPPQWTLVYSDPSVSHGLAFQFLGAGSNKIVFRIIDNGNPSGWVLAFQSNEMARPDTARQDFLDEISVLRRLGDAGLTVPGPFPNGAPSPNNLFTFIVNNLDSGNDGKTIYAFIIEYFNLRADFVEMDKQDSNPGAFMRTKVLTLPTARAHIDTTRAAVARILAEFNVRAWNDFQVLYEKSTGNVICFDPMPGDVNRDATLAVLNQWTTDLNAFTAVPDLEVEEKCGH